MREDTLRKLFEARRPLLDAWGTFVTSCVKDSIRKQLSGSCSIDLFLRIPPIHRVKSVGSFLEKALRRGKGYSNPLSEITDQVGTRFVVLLTKDVALVKSVIESSAHWNCEPCRDYEEERRSRPHHFDYQSVHYLLRPRIPVEIKGVVVPIDMPCEVQVRTLLQHAYAELAHDTVYKPAVEISPAVNRLVAKGAALVEATDDVFLKVSDEIEGVLIHLRELHEEAVTLYLASVGHWNQVDYVFLSWCSIHFGTQLNQPLLPI